MPSHLLYLLKCEKLLNLMHPKYHACPYFIHLPLNGFMMLHKPLHGFFINTTPKIRNSCFMRATQTLNTNQLKKKDGIYLSRRQKLLHV